MLVAEKQSLEHKVQELRRELGLLPITDASKASYVRVDSPEARASFWPEHFRARVHLPELPAGARYNSRYLPYQKFPGGFPGWDGHETLGRLTGWVHSVEVTPGESTIDVRLFETRKNQLQLDIEILGSGSDGQDNNSIFETIGPYNDSFVEGSSIRVGGALPSLPRETSPFEPFVLFRIRGEDPGVGVMIYIEPTMDGVPEGVETKEALVTAMEAAAVQ